MFPGGPRKEKKHFCRRHVVLLSATAEKLERVGVQTVGVVATNPARARLFFRYRPPRIQMGADPGLITHGAYGLPNTAVTPELWQQIQNKAVTLLRELEQPEAAPAEAYDLLGRLDGFEATESDNAEFQRHQAQLIEFLIDPDGIVHWANVEGAPGGLTGLDEVPSDDDLLTVARGLL